MIAQVSQDSLQLRIAGDADMDMVWASGIGTIITDEAVDGVAGLNALLFGGYVLSDEDVKVMVGGRICGSIGSDLCHNEDRVHGGGYPVKKKEQAAASTQPLPADGRLSLVPAFAMTLVPCLATLAGYFRRRRIDRNDR